MKRIFYYLLVAFGLVYFGTYIYTQLNAAEQGEMAPDFEARLIDGSDFKLSDLRGNYVLLDFWGSWCGPCRHANPKLVELYNKHSDKLLVVTVALEKLEGAGEAAALKDGFTWKHQIVGQHSLVMLSSIARKYGVSDIPSKFLIAPDGTLLPKMSFGEIDLLLSDK